MSQPPITQWPRLIIAGVSQHISDALASVSDVPLVFEGELPTDQSQESGPWVEFRRLGPHFRLMSKNNYYITFVLDLAIMELVETADNIYNSDNVVGMLLPYLDNIIIVDNSGDTNVTLGCMRRISQVQVKPWGRLGRNSLVKQTTVNVKFAMEIEEDA
jgi:hypothetical protein